MRRAWTIVTCVVFVGSIVSVCSRDWTWLARSGALVTVVALFAASFNTTVVSHLVITLLNDLYDPSESIYAEMREKPHLYGIGRQLTEQQAREVLGREIKRFNDDKQTLLRNEMRAELGKLQLSIAALGTMLWGFADLLNRI